MTRQRALEIMAERQKIVAERILYNLARSPAHAHLSPFARMEMADQQAFAIVNTPLDEMEEKLESIPGLTPDMFFMEIGE